jgi:hypothetical protein
MLSFIGSILSDQITSRMPMNQAKSQGRLHAEKFFMGIVKSSNSLRFMWWAAKAGTEVQHPAARQASS